MRLLPALAGLLLIVTPICRAEDNKPPKGFTALFNGKDTTNWQGAIDFGKRQKMTDTQRAEEQKKADAKILPHWTVEEGVLVNDGQGGNLGSVKDYGNFELYVDWKIEPLGDSGIYLRGNPQVQIWDSDKLDPKNKSVASDIGKGSGGLWNNTKNNKPLKKADRAPGEWNTFHIVMKDGKVTVRLNGELVVDNVALENHFEKDKPLPDKGPIELQAHYRADNKPGKLWFRNIYIKDLSN